MSRYTNNTSIAEALESINHHAVVGDVAAPGKRRVAIDSQAWPVEE